MPRDHRLFFKLTLDFPDHAKILPLSDTAFRCIVEAIAYSRKHETDGFLARRYAVARWSLEVLRELCENDPQKPTLIEREDGWIIHDYADMNDTSAEISARRERNKMAGKQGGLAKAKQRAKQPAKRLASEVLSENVAEEEEEKEIGSYLSRSAAVSNARETGGRSATPGAELVRAIIPGDYPNATKTELRLQANALLHEGQPPEAVEAALRLWLTKTGVGPRILPSLVADVLKAPLAQPTAKPHKMRALVELAQQTANSETRDRKELPA